MTAEGAVYCGTSRNSQGGIVAAGEAEQQAAGPRIEPSAEFDDERQRQNRNHAGCHIALGDWRQAEARGSPGEGDIAVAADEADDAGKLSPTARETSGASRQSPELIGNAAA